MLNMENAEEVMQILERFTRLKQKEIPKELDDYMNYVAKTGDTVFKWSSLKYLFREKLLNVIKNFHDTSPRVDDLPQYPNVDPFNYESMKSSLLERLELFNAAPFTIQRLCELLTEPRKQYSRIDKFMRALEKNILVSTIEPGRKRTESENGDSLDSVVNGDASLDVNVDIDMENEPIFNAEPPNATSSTSPSSQPSSNLIHKADDDILPNPKKPKLDLDETNDAETEAATKSITSDKTDTAEHSVEKVVADESADITDNKKKEEHVAEESTVSEEKPSDVNATATAEIAIVADANKDVKDSECEKMEEDSPAAAPTTENNNVDDKKDETESKAEEKVEPITTSKPAEVVEVDKVSPPTSTSEVVAAVEAVKTTENPQKIDDAPAPEENKKDCAEKVTEKQETVKDMEAGKVIKENDDDKENHNGDIKENKEKTEITITTINSEKIDDTKADSAPEKTIAANKEEKSEEILKEKTEEVVVASAAVVVEGSKKEVAEALKAGEIPSVVPEETSQPEEAKPAGEAVTAAEAVSVPVEEIKETNGSNTPEQVAKIVTADPPPPATESLQKESTETPAEIKPSEPKESEAEKAAEIPATTAAPPTESKDVAITIPVPVVVAAEPVVTADQPMEENPETIAEAEPVVPTIVVEAAANVEEVEMATDVIEPAKDEPAGMEVDDTSQEAMDQ